METKKKPATKKKPSKYDEKFVINGTADEVLKAAFKSVTKKVKK
jgi:hypothetical protein